MGQNLNFWNRVINFWGGKTRPSQKQLKGKRKQAHRRLTLENLEMRALLTAVPGSELADVTPAYNTFVVTTLSDTVNSSDRVLSLREAITAASDGDTITFSASLAKTARTIKLYNGALTIKQGITIDASSIGGITINAQNRNIVFYVFSDGVNLTNLTITGGNNSGVYNAGTLTMTNCLITKNQFTGNSADGGGGIQNVRKLTMINCAVTDNYSLGSSGGGIWMGDAGDYSDLTLTNCTIAGNSCHFNGGGIHCSQHSKVTAQNCIIANNTADNAGGGIYVVPQGIGNVTIDIFHSMFALNTPDDINVPNASVVTLHSIIPYNPLLPLFNGFNDYTLPRGSQAINVGDNGFLPDSITTDLAGNERIVDDIVDLGAYEYTRMLDTPTNLTLSADNTIVTASWDTVDNADQYILQYADNEQFTNAQTLTLTVNSVQIFNLKQSVRYYFRVQAQDTTEVFRDSKFSDVQSFVNPRAIGVTLSTDAPVIEDIIRVTHKPSSEKVDYHWYRVAADGTFQDTGKVSDRYKVTQADLGFSIRLVVTGKVAYKGLTTTVETAVIPLAAPKLAAIKPDGETLKATWHTSPNADHYTLFYSTASDFNTFKKVETDTNSVTIADLTLGHTYYLKVQASDTTGTYLNSVDSAVKSVKLNKLGAPEITNIKTAGSTVTVDWTLVKGADRYVINYSTNADFSGYKTKVINSATISSQTLTDLTMGKIYYVRVQARNTTNTYKTSEYSVRKITVNKIATPEITSLTQTDKSVTVKWSPVAKANRFVIYYSTSSTFDTQYSKVVDNALSGTITGLVKGKTYYFKVQARDTSGKFITSNDSEVRSLAFASALPSDANVFNDDEAFDFFDDEILAAFNEEPEVLDIF